MPLIRATHVQQSGTSFWYQILERVSLPQDREYFFKS